MAALYSIMWMNYDVIYFCSSGFFFSSFDIMINIFEHIFAYLSIYFLK